MQEQRHPRQEGDEQEETEQDPRTADPTAKQYRESTMTMEWREGT